MPLVGDVRVSTLPAATAQFLLLVSFCLGGSAMADEWTLPEIAEFYETSVRSIQTLEADFSGYTGRQFPSSLKGLDVDENGEVLFLEAHHAWEASTRRESLYRRQLMISSGVVHFDQLRAAFDGEKYRAYNPDPKSWSQLGGVVKPFEDQISLDHVWLPGFLGYSYAYAPVRGLWDLLESGAIDQSADTPPGIVVIRAEFVNGTSSHRQLRVEIDTQHGFLPRKIENFRADSETVVSRMIIDRFVSKSGLWIPVEMRRTDFYVGKDLPQGMTAKDIRGLNMEQRKAKGVKYVARVLGDEDGFHPARFSVDVETLRVNQPLESEEFALKFPEGVGVFDAFQANPADVRLPKSASPPATDDVDSGGPSFLFMLIVLNVGVLIVFAATLWFRHRRRGGS
jgi:hypothetical protein